MEAREAGELLGEPLAHQQETALEQRVEPGRVEVRRGRRGRSRSKRSRRSGRGNRRAVRLIAQRRAERAHRLDPRGGRGRLQQPLLRRVKQQQYLEESELLRSGGARARVVEAGEFVAGEAHRARALPPMLKLRAPAQLRLQEKALRLSQQR